MKIVYLWNDGTPVIVEKNEEGEYIYPNKKYTETPPPEGIYAPFYYDGQKWVGQSKEDWENALKDIQKSEINESDKINAELVGEVLEQQAEIDSLKLDVSQLMTLLLEKEGGLTDV